MKGTLSNGCLPTPVADPDKDGIYGAADLCPTVDGQGAANGCPGGVIPTRPRAASRPGALPPAAKPLAGAAGLKSGALLKRVGLGKGLGVKVTCSRDSTAGLSLSLSAKVAKKLKLKLKRGAKSLVIATGSGACKAAGGATVKLKLGSSVKRKVLKGKGRVAATLTLRLTAPGATPVSSATSVKVG